MTSPSPAENLVPSEALAKQSLFILSVHRMALLLPLGGKSLISLRPLVWLFSVEAVSLRIDSKLGARAMSSTSSSWKECWTLQSWNQKGWKSALDLAAFGVQGLRAEHEDQDLAGAVLDVQGLVARQEVGDVDARCLFGSQHLLLHWELAFHVAFQQDHWALF